MGTSGTWSGSGFDVVWALELAWQCDDSGFVIISFLRSEMVLALARYSASRDMYLTGQLGSNFGAGTTGNVCLEQSTK